MRVIRNNTATSFMAAMSSVVAAMSSVVVVRLLVFVAMWPQSERVLFTQGRGCVFRFPSLGFFFNNAYNAQTKQTSPFHNQMHLLAQVRHARHAAWACLKLCFHFKWISSELGWCVGVGWCYVPSLKRDMQTKTRKHNATTISQH